MGACGDVVRNTMGPAAPIKDAVHADTQKLTEEISQRFLWRSRPMPTSGSMAKRSIRLDQRPRGQSRRA
jgi:hypothetical protein